MTQQRVCWQARTGNDISSSGIYQQASSSSHQSLPRSRLGLSPGRPNNAHEQVHAHHQLPTRTGPRIELHPRLYHADGDLILAAQSRQDTDATVLFRVDRVVLTRASPEVLGKRFSEPLSAEVVYAVHCGVPLVKMAEDAEELGGLLEGVYDPV